MSIISNGFAGAMLKGVLEGVTGIDETTFYISLHTVKADLGEVSKSNFLSSEATSTNDSTEDYARESIGVAAASWDEAEGILSNSAVVNFTDVTLTANCYAYALWKNDNGNVESDFLFGATLSTPLLASDAGPSLPKGTIVLAIGIWRLSGNWRPQQFTVHTFRLAGERAFCPNIGAAGP